RVLRLRALSREKAGFRFLAPRSRIAFRASVSEGLLTSGQRGVNEKALNQIREVQMRVFVKSSCLALAAAASLLAAAGHANAEQKKYVVGVSNTLIGNGWREEMICSIKAEAQASGLVSKVIVANRNGGPSEQIADIRNLISAGANAIIINPSDRDALNPVIKQAAEKGIVVVAVDQAVSAPEAYVLTNDQVGYAKVGAKWLFDKLGGK